MAHVGTVIGNRDEARNHMEQPSPSAYVQSGAETLSRNEAHSSGVSWAAVMAGALVVAALSLALLALGAGIGFSVISPWADAGASASRIGRTAIVWFVLMQLIASSVGATWQGDYVPDGSIFTPMKSISEILRMVFLSGPWVSLSLRLY